jgi:hypothetical protein
MPGLDLLGQPLARVELAARDHYVRAMLGKRANHLAPETPAAARDQGDLSRQINRHQAPA